MRFDSLHPADQLVLTMKRIYSNGMTTASAGNLSIRDSDGDLWITPHGIDKGNLESQDIVRIRPDGTVIGHREPSSDLTLHRAIMNSKPQVQAVLHAHSPALIVFAMIHELPALNNIPNLALQCCPVRMIPFGSCDDEGRARLLEDSFRRDYRAVIIENHGVYVAAESMTKVYRIFETLERGAMIELLARRNGSPVELSDNEVNVARTIAHTRLTEFTPRSRSTEEKAMRRDMVRTIQRAVHQGIFGATHGTLSSRLSDGTFLITPFGMDRLEISDDDLVLIRRSMKESGKVPSRAVFLHEVIYNKNPEIKTIISAQPPHLTALSVLRKSLDMTALPECHGLLTPMPLIPYGQNYEQPQATAAAFNKDIFMIMLENDGVIVTGRNMSRAYDRIEDAEAVARAVLNLPRPAEPLRPIDEETLQQNGDHL